MSLADVSVKRPIFISCIVLLMILVGWLSMNRLPVDMFPNITFPVVVVNTPYPGAGPSEIETLVSKPVEEELSTLGGVKRVSSINREGLSTVIAEFTLETDVKYAEQQIRDRVSATKRKLPPETKDSIIRRIDPAEQPIAILALKADLPDAKLYDLANEIIRPKFEQINQVGLVEVLGGRKREIQVQLDRAKLKSYEVPATLVAQRIAASGMNVPAGRVDEPAKQTVFRTLGEFKSVKDIESTIVNFIGNDVPVRVKDLGSVVDTLEDEKSVTLVNGRSALTLMIFRQSGANTIRVVDEVKKRLDSINAELKGTEGNPALSLANDGSKPIRANVADVKESIIIGIILTIIVVFFFLGNFRSTLITGLALPNSLIGAFVLMAAAGFSVNVMTLLALSLTVGLLIDDAIVVRENIFRHLEMGRSPVQAALDGTKEVSLAVIATTLTVIAVFGPIAFLKGVVGQFFKEFGLTVCFAMLISLFDALTIAPMLSAYLAKRGEKYENHGAGSARTKNPLRRAVLSFSKFQDWLEEVYTDVIRWTLKHPLKTIIASIAIFFGSIALMVAVPKTFLPAQDFGEFMVGLDLPPGTPLNKMAEVSKQVDEVIRKNPEVAISVQIVGSREGESNVASFYVGMVPASERRINTSALKARLREQLKPFVYANPTVKDVDMVAAGQRPFNVNIVGDDLAQVEKYAKALHERLKTHPALLDPDISYRPGKPEFQVVPDKTRMERLGISTTALGMELRTLVEGTTPAVFREEGREYDIRVRLKDGQRNLREGFAQTYVPNVNFSLVRLSDVAKPIETVGPADIRRQDRARYISISADLKPGGAGMGAAMTDITTLLTTGDLKLPEGMKFVFVGQAENFQELTSSMAMAALLGIVFIYFVLASLYESPITPFTIMLVLPLAASGAFIALFITRSSFDLFSMIGAIMLLGIATKNSILLVDRAVQLVQEGQNSMDAMIEAGRTRLRPILMTTLALIAGMLPIAIGLNEASKQRTSMGISIIGGLITSTLLSLVVVPAAFSYIERFRSWSRDRVTKAFHGKA
jgi:HAE1 family hydrophobic/amphiphilic exporter-1